MALEQYRKLSHVTTEVEQGVITRADLLADVTAGTVVVVNLKGRMLTAAQVEAHLDGRVDGETVSR